MRKVQLGKSGEQIPVLGQGTMDIKSGKEAGIKTIGVTTGIYSEEQLKDAGADFVVKNLKDKDEILRIISL